MEITAFTILSIAGLIAEIAGVLFMANGYLRLTPWYQIPMVLFKSLWSKKTAKGLTALKELMQEDVAWVIRGLALIATGFVLQTIGILLNRCG